METSLDNTKRFSVIVLYVFFVCVIVRHVRGHRPGTGGRQPGAIWAKGAGQLLAHGY